MHGLPVYLVVLIMGACSIVVDGLIDAAFVADTLRHMPWELFSFVTGSPRPRVAYPAAGSSAETFP